MSGFRRDMMLSIGVTGLTSVLGLLSSILVARLAGIEELGRFAFVQSIVLMALILVQIGLPDLVLREVSKSSRQAPQFKHTLDLLCWATRLTVGVGVVVVAGMLSIFALSAWANDSIILLLILAPLLLISPRMNIASSALRSLGRPIGGQLPDKIVRPGVLVVIFVSCLIFIPSRNGSAELVALATLAGYVMAWATSELMLRRRLSFARREADKALPVYLDRKTLLIAAISLGAINAVQVFNTNLDFVALGFLSSASETGSYRVATALGSISAMGLLAVNMVAGPRIAAARTAEDMLDHLRRIVAQAALLSLLVSGLFTFIVLAAGKTALTLLYGPEFAAAAIPLAIIALGQLASSMFGPVALTLAMLGHERSVLAVMAATLLLKIAIIGFVVPAFGASGAAVASSINLVVWNVALWLRARAVLDIDTSAIGGLSYAFRRT